MKFRLAFVFILLAGGLSFVDIRGQARAFAQTPNVIPIGDSITADAIFRAGSWRKPLKDNLSGVGQAINYVGTQTDASGERFEAYPGFTSCDFFLERPDKGVLPSGTSPTWDIHASLDATSPNIASGRSRLVAVVVDH